MRSPDLDRSRRFLAITGVLALIGGIVAFLVPAIASVATATFIGWVLLFGGVAGIFGAFGGGAGAALLRLLVAALTIAAGLYLLVAPLEGVFTLTVMLVIWFVAIGFARIAGGLAALGTPGAGLTIANGAISVLLGILIGNELPESSDWAIGLLVGIDLLFYGATALWLSFGLKGIEAAPPDTRTAETRDVGGAEARI